MVRALLIAALAAAALAIPVPVPADGAYIPTAEDLEAPAETDFLGSLLDAYEVREESVGGGVENRQENLDKMIEDFGMPVSDAAIPDAAERAGVDEDGAQEGGLAVGDVSEPNLPVQRRLVDTGDLDTSALDASALDTSSLNTDSLTTDSLITALPTSTTTKRSDDSIPALDPNGEFSTVRREPHGLPALHGRGH